MLAQPSWNAARAVGASSKDGQGPHRSGPQPGAMVAVAAPTPLSSSFPFIKLALSSTLSAMLALLKASSVLAGLLAFVGLPSAKQAPRPRTIACKASQSRQEHSQKLVRSLSDLSEELKDNVYSAAPFTNLRGQRIFTQSWLPAGGGGIRALVLVVHGLNEHGGRYAAFAKALNLQGFGVFALDWIGHGGSDGLHGYVERLEYVISDVRTYLKMVSMNHPNVPCFLFGHSTGGAIALQVQGWTSLLNLSPCFQRLGK
eukprot:SM002563S09129  [mRNA]  locus=s2563:20:1545:- [translate_table: standard]